MKIKIIPVYNGNAQQLILLPAQLQMIWYLQLAVQ